jgi:hypothetical protein
MFFGSNAASGLDVTAVASVENTHTPQIMEEAGYYIVDGASAAFEYVTELRSMFGVELPLWASHVDSTIEDDGCHGFDSDIDLTGKVALIRRGSCILDTKAESAYERGARYVVFYNNVPGLTYLPISDPAIPRILGAAFVCISSVFILNRLY